MRSGNEDNSFQKDQKTLCATHQQTYALFMSSYNCINTIQAHLVELLIFFRISFLNTDIIHPKFIILAKTNSIISLPF